MKCPIDNADLLMTERQGIEIDYCPTCRGVWLDRGELDKLIERGSADVASAPRIQAPAPRIHESDSYSNHSYQKRHKKEGFLGDLFDF